MRKLFNIVLYQSIWFLCILANQIGPLISLLLIVAHLLTTDKRAADLRMMGFLVFIGLLIDGTLHQVGFFSFTNSGFPIPFWLMVIWLGLAITPHHCLAWMQNRPLLSVLFGGLGGPAAYWAGVRLGAASFNWPLGYSLALLALVWALIWPAIMHYSVISRTPPHK